MAALPRILIQWQWHVYCSAVTLHPPLLPQSFYSKSREYGTVKQHGLIGKR